MAVDPNLRGFRLRWLSGTTKFRPHIYLADGSWWVLCKHLNRTGPYRDARLAFMAAAAIWTGQP